MNLLDLVAATETEPFGPVWSTPGCIFPLGFRRQSEPARCLRQDLAQVDSVEKAIAAGDVDLILRLGYALELLQYLSAVYISAVEFQRLFVVGDGQVFVAVCHVSLAQTVVGIPRIWVELNV